MITYESITKKSWLNIVQYQKEHQLWEGGIATGLVQPNTIQPGK